MGAPRCQAESLHGQNMALVTDPAQALPMAASTTSTPPASQGGCHLLQLLLWSCNLSPWHIPEPWWVPAQCWGLLSHLASPGAELLVGQTSRVSFYNMQQQTKPEPTACGEPQGRSPPVCSTLQSHAGAQWGAGCRRQVGPGGVPGSPPRLAELAAVAAWEPRAGCRCSSQVLLWEFLATACTPCKIPGDIFSAGRRDVYRFGREGFCSQSCACVCVCVWREGGAPLMPSGRACMVLGAQGAAARWFVAAGCCSMG